MVITDRTPGDWTILTASARGSRHVRIGSPNQDAARWEAVGASHGHDVTVVTVADGHGGDRYVRSDIGSRLAVGIACSVARSTIGTVGLPRSHRDLERLARRDLIPAIVSQWRDECSSHLAAEPFDDSERDRAGVTLEDHPLLAYGTTLLVAILRGDDGLLLQLGDGDCMIADTAGNPSFPIATDQRLVGGETTSLCLPGAERDFRVGVVQSDLVRLVLLSTDGYGVAFEDPRWRERVTRDLLRELDERGVDHVDRMLPDWLRQSAEVGGDDATVALAYRSPSPASTAGAGTNRRSERKGSIWRDRVIVGLAGIAIGVAIAGLAFIDRSVAAPNEGPAPQEAPEDEPVIDAPPDEESPSATDDQPADGPPLEDDNGPEDEGVGEADAAEAPEVEPPPSPMPVPPVGAESGLDALPEPDRVWIVSSPGRVVGFALDPEDPDPYLLVLEAVQSFGVDRPTALYAWGKMWSIVDGELMSDGSAIRLVTDPAVRLGSLALYENHLWVVSEDDAWLVAMDVPGLQSCYLVPVRRPDRPRSNVDGATSAPAAGCRVDPMQQG